MTNRKPLFIILFSLGYSAIYSQEQQVKSDSIYQLQEVVVSSQQILGSKFKARNRTGSAYYISPEEIRKLGYTDINRMLKAVPGVNMYEEDGFGLRPNISLRGTKAERSERISIMEDGVLAAPAPYSAPAAYYFPNAARMEAIEVLKGSSQVQYGPFTTGGAVNLVSTPIPNNFSGKANISYGSKNTFKSHAAIGSNWKHFGYMVEYLRYQSDGFKRYEDYAAEGFKRNDIIAKMVVKTDKVRGVNHALELKFGYAGENSDETYVGLSADDFKKTPFLRYAGSQMDKLKTDHQQWVATYLLTFSNKLKVTTNAYYNYFHRNWYKLNDVRAGITSKEKISVADVLIDPETNIRYFDILTGKTDREGEALLVRANNRTYRSRGIQTRAEYRFNVKEFFFDLEFGLRYHADEEDRFQWDDSYSMKNKKMVLFMEGIHGTNANRVTSANALASYLLAKLRYNVWTITAGLRYEDIDLLKKDYTKEDLARSGKVRIETPNHARVLIPGIGVHYQLLPAASVFFGVHKGFAPPSAELYQKPESSVNMELGTRVSIGKFKAELIGFYNNYSNMLGSDLAASGGSGTLEQFNVGEARVKGAEFLVQYQPLPHTCSLRLPLQLSYTYTDTEMRNSFESHSWGNVVRGDEIPYIFKHALNMQLGIEYKWFYANIGARYNSDMRTSPGQGTIAEREKVPANLILDASVNVLVNKYLTLRLNAINLTNRVYLTSRHPAGLRAGHPFGIYAGANVQF
ncbi:TonB-dependent receptor family protein [Bacteroides hominis]|uniref:TonB-dependent receptor n=3 Tax=Bacteroides TaxID=816 RepID=A0AAP9NBQ8_BACFG|nr:MULTISPECIES: TonB-dependent receptor [Bacteroides]EFR52565.1 TonB-dependent receptor [Bacteroides fragilis 3_1_12]MBM6510926.1 TonB-dependent receptor [Bacteroides fragilis]MDV6135176.1 TonB-dependent receptor [Bacteroides hominis (ex Liu et al. 2022)]MDV6150150.1 TonB-dependent receptor [Bacteroides hominis (ex Liu et al. 2022)]MDV6164008.1 TonB-dependent receptor [Bacteroides hominis (ex Liu et al. 2022)]